MMQENLGQQSAQSPTGQPSQNIGIMRSFPKNESKGRVYLLVIAILVVVAGVGSGWLLTTVTSGKSKTQLDLGGVSPGGEVGKNEAGISDESTFRDSAEGKLIEGGIDGEGTHHLDRDMGEEKYVYLTSTVIDLQGFVNKKVKVWGETIAAQKAGWLMDVGKIKVIE